MEEYYETSLFSRPFVSAVIVAAGDSIRMGGNDKQFLELNGVPVLVRSMRAFEVCPVIGEIIVVAKAESVRKVDALALEFGITKYRGAVPGGAKRAESVRSGVSAVSDQVEFIAIHDGARPLVLPEDIEKCAQDAFRCGAAVLAVPVVDTIKYGKKNGFVEYTPARERLFAVQTPQIFEKSAYLTAMQRAFRELPDWTDDSRIFENDARKVFLTQGSRDNIKITSPEDIAAAEALLKLRGGKML